VTAASGVGPVSISQSINQSLFNPSLAQWRSRTWQTWQVGRTERQHDCCS